MRGVLCLVDFRKRMRDRVRFAFMRAVLGSLQNQPNMAGFALVVWDERGCSTVSYDACEGAVSLRMVPEHVKAAIHGQIIASDTGWRYKLDDEQ